MLEINDTLKANKTDETKNEDAAKTTKNAYDTYDTDKTNNKNDKIEPCEMCGTSEKHELKAKTLEYNSTDKLLLLGALALGILFSGLFYGNYPGISVPIIVIAFYALILSYTRPLLTKEAKFGWFLSIPVLMISLTFFLYGNEILHVLNLLALPMLILLQTLLITGVNSFKWDSPGIIADILYCVFGRCLYHAARPFRFVSSALRGKKGYSGKNTAVKVLIGMFISLPLISVLILLLSSADMVFGELVKKLPVFFREINMGEFIGRTVAALIVFILSFSYTWSLGHGEKLDGILPDGAGSKPPYERRRWDQVTVITVTVAVDVLYIAFAAVQFVYLFGRSGLPEGFTYAGYARRGFFELILVSLLNIGILACTLTYTKRCKRWTDIVLKILNSIMICCTFIMLYSAHYRMSLYENAYGFTFLRVMTHAFMVFLLILIIITLARVWFTRLPLLKPYIVVAVAAFTIINYINVDAIIAGNNIKRYYETNNIDMDYFRTLSNGIAADLTMLAKDKDPLVSSAARDMLEQRRKRLSAERSWQSFNLTDYRAQRLLEKGW